MVNRVIQQKRTKMRRAYLKRPIRVSMGPSRASIPDSQQAYFDYRQRGQSIAFDEDWAAWFFRVPDLKATGLYRTVTDPRQEAIDNSKKFRAYENATFAVLEGHTDFSQWADVFVAITLRPGSRTWTKVFVCRDTYMFVQKVSPRLIRKSIPYSKDRWKVNYDNNTIQWVELLEAPREVTSD